MAETHIDVAANKIGQAQALLDALRATAGERGAPALNELESALSGAIAHLNNCRFLTTEELAERWRASCGTLHNWRVSGDGPAFIRPGGKTRGRVLYPMSAIEAWEAGNQFTSTTECQNYRSRA